MSQRERVDAEAVVYQERHAVWGLALVIATTFLVACSDSTPTAKSKAAQIAVSLPTAIDTSTPDRALKAYWTYVDWTLAMSHANDLQGIESKTYQEAMAVLGKVATPAMVGIDSRKPALSSYSREITEAKSETESRAIVVAQIKNITPMPADAVLEERQRKARENGKRFKYVMEKDEQGWKIAAVLEWDNFDNEYRKLRPTEGKVLPIYVFEGF